MSSISYDSDIIDVHGGHQAAFDVLRRDIQAAKKTKPKLTIEDVKKHLTSPAKKAPTAPKKDPLGIL